MMAPQLGLVLLAAALAGAEAEGGPSQRQHGMTFGPKQCVTLTRSRSGSCLIRTDCEDEVVDNISFVFDCVSGEGDIRRHDFGLGGFDNVEEYDTEVKCERCELPHLKAPKSHKKASKKVERPVEVSSVEGSQVTSFRAERLNRLVTTLGTNHKMRKPATNSQGKDKFASDSAHVKYGPGACVETYRAKSGHCIMKTSCKGVDTSAYNFGLLCQETGGTLTRHLFGKASFDPTETFDTLIQCKECLGVESPEDVVSVAAAAVRASEPNSGAKTLRKLEAALENITEQMPVMQEAINKLEAAVYNEGAVAASEEADVGEAGDAAESPEATGGPQTQPDAEAPAPGGPEGADDEAKVVTNVD